jgi:hypothetical protein
MSGGRLRVLCSAQTCRIVRELCRGSTGGLHGGEASRVPLACNSLNTCFGVLSFELTCTSTHGHPHPHPWPTTSNSIHALHFFLCEVY